MTDSNLQREVILPSEKAKSYKMRMDAMKRQGSRTDLTSTPLARKIKGKETAEMIGEMSGESKDQVRRYIRLNELIPELLQMVDNSISNVKPQIAMRPAVELSYLPKKEQQLLVEAVQKEEHNSLACTSRKNAQTGRSKPFE
jgi:ParB family chromosome partitioning protein